MDKVMIIETVGGIALFIGLLTVGAFHAQVSYRKR